MNKILLILGCLVSFSSSAAFANKDVNKTVIEYRYVFSEDGIGEEIKNLINEISDYYWLKKFDVYVSFVIKISLSIPVVLGLIYAILIAKKKFYR